MKKGTKQFVIIVLIFLLLLLIPLASYLFSERQAAQEISALGGRYESVLPISAESREGS